MMYKAQLKNWAMEQSLMTWRSCNKEKMPTAECLQEINMLADNLYENAYHLTQDWQDMRNIMAQMAETVELAHLEEFKDYMAMMFEQRDRKENLGVANAVAKFSKKDAH